MLKIFGKMVLGKIFENRRSDVGRAAMSAAIDAVGEKLLQSQEIHGEDSPETARLLCALASMLFLGERYAEAEELIKSYLAVSEKIHGPNSYEMASGLELLSRIYDASGRTEDASSLDRECSSILDNPGKCIERDPLVEALYNFSLEYQSQDDSTVGGLGYTLSLMTLSWLATGDDKTGPVYDEFLPRVRALFPSHQAGEPAWEWLVRRARNDTNDFIGLLSVLAEEELPPGVPAREYVDQLRERNHDKDGGIMKYRIVHLPDETVLKGFTLYFPLSVAKFDLSFRVEQLLAYGCERLRNYDHLNLTLVVVSPCPEEVEQNATQVLVWDYPIIFKEQEDRAQAFLKQIVTEYGAYAAMILSATRLYEEGLEGEPVALPGEALVVFAGDAQSHLVGLQRYSKEYGTYSFDEPIVLMNRVGWLSDYDFPIEPKPRAKPAEKKAKKKNRRK